MKTWVACLVTLWMVSACDDGVQAVKVEGHAKKPYEKNAVDAKVIFRRWTGNDLFCREND